MIGLILGIGFFLEYNLNMDMDSPFVGSFEMRPSLDKLAFEC